MSRKSTNEFLSGFAAKQAIGANQFQCAICDEIFDKGWSDEEADKEFTQNFPGESVENCDLVCGDCYKMVMRSMK